MKYNQTIIQLLKRLWTHISYKRRKQLLLLLCLMVAASFAEILSIGSLLPFLTVLTAPQKVFELTTIQPIIKLLNIKSSSQLLLPLTVVFGLTAIFAGLMRLCLLFANTRLSYAIGADLSINIYKRTLYQPYLVHCSRNSSEVVDGISIKAGNAIGIIGYVLNIISAKIILLAVLIAIFSINPILTLITFAVFGFVYLGIIRLTKGRQFFNSHIIAKESTNVIQALQEGLGGIRDVLIDGSQLAYCNVYQEADLKMRRAQASNLFIASCPRYGIEALGMLFIAVIAYSLSQQADGILKIIPTLGMLALAAQRLLPVLQQLYASWTGIRGSQASLQDVLDMLDQSLPPIIDKIKPISFNKSIELKKIKFHYPSNEIYILKDINLTIKKGSCVGFIGATGHGKSTLLDILMGLLLPTHGSLEIDGKGIGSKNSRSWQVRIAHVPQSIFLADSSIAENIAFGIPKKEIDHDRVLRAARQAQIAKTIEGWPEKYQTHVGERGVRLSGGQRQRIGIARALYKESDVIILDEATSALDAKTEAAVMKAIYDFNEKITVIIVAHRLTTLKQCSQIIELSEGRITKIGAYKDIIRSLQKHEKE